MHQVSTSGHWSRADHERVTFEGFDPDELPTDVEAPTDVDPTEPGLHPDELPTVQVERGPLFSSDEPPTRPDVHRVMHVLRRRAGLPTDRPVQSTNRAHATPIAPTRHMVPPPRRTQVVLERPVQRAIQRGPVTIEDPVTLAPLVVPWTFADEYGWWMAGAACGGIVGSLLSGLALTAAVLV